MNENLLVLLRCLSMRHEYVYQDKDGNYISKQCEVTNWIDGCEKKSIESRLQFELFGEYPLSDKNQSDWDS